MQIRNEIEILTGQLTFGTMNEGKWWIVHPLMSLILDAFLEVSQTQIIGINTELTG